MSSTADLPPLIPPSRRAGLDAASMGPAFWVHGVAALGLFSLGAVAATLGKLSLGHLDGLDFAMGVMHPITSAEIAVLFPTRRAVQSDLRAIAWFRYCKLASHFLWCNCLLGRPCQAQARAGGGYILSGFFLRMPASTLQLTLLDLDTSNGLSCASTRPSSRRVAPAAGKFIQTAVFCDRRTPRRS